MMPNVASSIPHYNGAAVRDSTIHERPRQIDALQADEIAFLKAVESEIGIEESSIMSCWLRKVITTPFGISDDKRAKIFAIARRLNFRLPSSF
jgi:hypothetical protein